MRVVVDANVIVAAMIRPGGWTAHELRRTDVHWIVPAFLAEELEEHAAEYADKAGCTTAEWRRRVESLTARMEVVPASALLGVRDSTLVRKAHTVDADDAPYLAAVVAADADFLWTRDAAVLDAFAGVAVSVVPMSSTEATG